MAAGSGAPDPSRLESCPLIAIHSPTPHYCATMSTSLSSPTRPLHRCSLLSRTATPLLDSATIPSTPPTLPTSPSPIDCHPKVAYSPSSTRSPIRTSCQPVRRLPKRRASPCSCTPLFATGNTTTSLRRRRHLVRVLRRRSTLERARWD